jgi:hypothetical protein
MKVVSFRSLGAFALCALLISMLSCAHDQQLVSIAIQPSEETFGASDIPVAANAGSSVQLRALGTYIHPPVTKDITSQVTWTTNTPDIATVDASGLLVATGAACGNALISATVQTNHSAGDRPSSGAIVTGTMTANVVCFSGTSSNPFLVVNIPANGTATGTVVSSPSGINCPGICGATFTTGSTVTLTAGLTGTSTSVQWAGCVPTPNPLVCTVILSGNTSVTATFQ